MLEYVEAKKIIFKYQKKNDILILNYDDPSSLSFLKEAQAKVYFFSQRFSPEKDKKIFCFLRDGNIVLDKEEVLDVKDLKIFGSHNISNVLASVLVANLLNIPLKSIKKQLKSFKGVPSRQEFIREVRGVKYFNDTTATMPEAAILALKTFSSEFSSKIILIAGGVDKKLNYRALAKEINKKADHVILLPGTATEKIKKELSCEAINVRSMKEAVYQASLIAKEGDIVLLSPGAASFNLFDNEFDRGDQFVKLVKNLQ